jgi:hypothetical protein
VWYKNSLRLKGVDGYLFVRFCIEFCTGLLYMTSISKDGREDFLDPPRLVCGILIVFMFRFSFGFVSKLNIDFQMCTAMKVIRASTVVVAEVTRVVYFMLYGFV